MLVSSCQIHNLSDLRNFVYETLGSFYLLEINAYRMTERILMRAGRPCGILFCLDGPRKMKCTAIWETDRNTILFYGSCGRRLHKTQLVAAPELESLAA